MVTCQCVIPIKCEIKSNWPLVWCTCIWGVKDGIWTCVHWKGLFRPLRSQLWGLVILLLIQREGYIVVVVTYHCVISINVKLKSNWPLVWWGGGQNGILACAHALTVKTCYFGHPCKQIWNNYTIFEAKIWKSGSQLPKISINSTVACFYGKIWISKFWNFLTWS